MSRRRTREDPIRQPPSAFLRHRCSAALARVRRGDLLERPAAWALLVVAAVLLRLPRLGESLWYDEVYYSTRERFANWPALRDSLHTSIAAPLYRLVLFAWTGLFGEHEVVVRLPSLLCGVGSIVLTYELARRIVGRGPALLAGIWLGLAPAHVWYSQEATPYAMAAFLVTAAAALAFHVADTEGPAAAPLALYLVALAGAVFCHYYAIVVLVPLSACALFARPRARAGLLTANALVAAGFGAMLWAKSASGRLVTGQGFLRPFDAFEAWMLHFHWFLHGNTIWRVSPYRASLAHLVAHPGLLLLQLAAAALVARGIWRVSRGGRPARGAALIGLLVALPLLLGALTAAGYRRLYIERYAFFVLPFFAVVLAAGATEFRRRRVGRGVAAGLVGAAAVAWAAWYVEDDRWTVYKQNPDWRAVVSEVAARGHTRETAVMLYATPAIDLRFYVRRRFGASAPAVLPANRLRFHAAKRRGMRTVYLVENLYWRGGVQREIEKLEGDPRLRRRALHELHGVRLHEFEMRPAAAGSPDAGRGGRGFSGGA